AIDRMGDPSKLQPGSMISVELMMGDFGVGADGTLTAIDGNKVYAFGHRLLSPYLLQMAVFSALDSTARATGVLSVSMHGSIEFQNRSDVAQIRNVYA